MKSTQRSAASNRPKKLPSRGLNENAVGLDKKLKKNVVAQPPSAVRNIAGPIHGHWNPEDIWGALEESVKLQSHYATLLNMHDGGERLSFENAEAWMIRLESMEFVKRAQTNKNGGAA